ncbi:hypothetical protein R6Q59_024096 [Mikania micrantha]
MYDLFYNLVGIYFFLFVLVMNLLQVVAETTLAFIKEASAIGVKGFNVYHKNRVIHDNSEDDFESPLPKFLQYDKLRRILIPNSPLSLCTFIQPLNAMQNATVSKIGFASILEFKITSLPTCLGYWLLANYDPTTCKLNLGSHVVKITPQLVKQVLEIPMESTKLKELGKPSIRDPVVAEFRSQFHVNIVLPDINDVRDLVKNEMIDVEDNVKVQGDKVENDDYVNVQKEMEEDKKGDQKEDVVEVQEWYCIYLAPQQDPHLDLLFDPLSFLFEL